MGAASVRPWGCIKCGALAGEPCRSLTTRRVTDTHAKRLKWDGVLTTDRAHPASGDDRGEGLGDE